MRTGGHENPASQNPADRPSRARPTGSGRRVPLNTRQRAYLTVFYQLDQEEERRQRRRWHQRLHRDPAEQWRWIPYATDHPAADPTPAQQLLDRQGIKDPGTGSTLAALVRRRMIDLRHITVESTVGSTTQTQVRLTPQGRAEARGNQPQEADLDRLPGWLHQALHTIAEPENEPVPRTTIGRTSARRLGPRGLGYIEDASTWAYRLGESGRAYLERTDPTTDQR
ncbi:hypothetical protein F4560_003183 [Saccharothrix ecbatanensis]|uniref:Uncharacterized protein n=1 Tax=Saccharothrix ecbatanensis TaxID=1105145 RepID=A0A7W9HJL0_9PSEU|nr:hypothetical protein [Saccharothrix ecbatanensis]MBB5803415.1 hypothetical protein [Saccharothrix ecbatanensis]